MDRAEIAEGLKRTARWMQNPNLMEALRAAIALIEPQPVTEAGLREAGSVEDGCGTLCYVPETWAGPYLAYEDGGFFLHSFGPSIPLHITDMQQLHTVIAALRGTATND